MYYTYIIAQSHPPLGVYVFMYVCMYVCTFIRLGANWLRFTNLFVVNRTDTIKLSPSALDFFSRDTGLAVSSRVRVHFFVYHPSIIHIPYYTVQVVSLLPYFLDKTSVRLSSILLHTVDLPNTRTIV